MHPIAGPPGDHERQPPAGAAEVFPSKLLRAGLQQYRYFVGHPRRNGRCDIAYVINEDIDLRRVQRHECGFVSQHIRAHRLILRSVENLSNPIFHPVSLPSRVTSENLQGRDLNCKPLRNKSAPSLSYAEGTPAWRLGPKAGLA